MKLRVISYNIHKCIGGLDRRYAPERIAQVINNLSPDVLLLQEVDQGAPRSNHDHQVDVLGDLVGLRHRTWFPNVEVRGGGHYGNAILSRYPIVETTNIDLSVRFKKRRSVLHGVIRVRHDDIDNPGPVAARHPSLGPLRGSPRVIGDLQESPGISKGNSTPGKSGRSLIDRTVHVYNMHLGLARYERRKQIATFLDSHPFASLHHETPIVVGGDLNDVYGGLGNLLEPAGFRGVERRPLTFPAWGPMRPLDAIFVRGPVDFLGLSRCETELARRASDHRPLVADVQLLAIRHPHK